MHKTQKSDTPKVTTTGLERTNVTNQGSTPGIGDTDNIEQRNTPILCKEDGEEEGATRIHEIQCFLRERFDFRYNVVNQRVEFKPKGKKEFTELADFEQNTMLIGILKEGIKCSGDILNKILLSDFSIKFDPFMDYINRLPAYDGVTDYIQQLCETVNVTNTEFWDLAFKKWLVASLASLIEPSVINHSVIIFTGPQGIGKTTWMENLIPKELNQYMFSGTIKPENKDTMLHLSECWYINLDELENMTKTDIGTLKEIVTKSHIRVRRAYGRNNEKYIRRASFMGSVNASHFLTDTSGNRRWLCFEVTDIKYDHGISIEHVYAQALYLYKSGFKFWFGKEDILEIEANNEQFRIKSIEEELLLTYYDPIAVEDAKLFLSASKLLVDLTNKEPHLAGKCNHVMLGKLLKKLQFQHVKKKGIGMWAVREKPISEIGGSIKASIFKPFSGINKLDMPENLSSSSMGN